MINGILVDDEGKQELLGGKGVLDDFIEAAYCVDRLVIHSDEVTKILLQKLAYDKHNPQHDRKMHHYFTSI